MSKIFFVFYKGRGVNHLSMYQVLIRAIIFNIPFSFKLINYFSIPFIKNLLILSLNIQNLTIISINNANLAFFHSHNYKNQLWLSS